MTEDPDRIEKTLDLRAPRSRVWRALTTPRELGAWFGLGEPLELSGTFEPGSTIMARWPGRTDLEVFCTVEAIEHERRLSFRWMPCEVSDADERARLPTTLVEMRLSDIEVGTRLTISESGFAALPPDKQYKRGENARGWEIQLQSIAQHLLGGVTVKVERHIAKPPAVVFDAIVDPTKLAQYFVSRASGRLASEANVTWEWADVAATLAIEVVQYEQDKKVSFVWAASGTPTKVTLMLEPVGAGTKLVATEAPFALTEVGAARAMHQTEGWTDFGCCLKAYLQHGIDLRHGKPADHVA